jgi:hypothetical protein
MKATKIKGRKRTKQHKRYEKQKVKVTRRAIKHKK